MDDYLVIMLGSQSNWPDLKFVTYRTEARLNEKSREGKKFLLFRS